MQVGNISGDTNSDFGTVANVTDEPAAPASKTEKHRFWLAFAALFLAGFMAFLALGALSAGEGLAEDLAPMMRGETLFTFRLLATGFFALVPACLWLGYKLRPGGD